MDENKRGSFGSTIGFLLSAIGSAVGLGNIWGFPYKMGRCGGFTFLIVSYESSQGVESTQRLIATVLVCRASTATTPRGVVIQQVVLKRES